MVKLNKAKKRVVIGISAAVGAFGAALVDIVQKGEGASAVVQLTDGMRVVLQIPIPRLGVVFVLMGFAIAVCFFTKIKTTQMAFYVGLSILSIMMNFAPYRLSPSFLTYPPKETLLKFPTENSLAYNFFRRVPCFAQLPGETPTLPGETPTLPGETPTLPGKTQRFVPVNIELITKDERPISEVIVKLQDSLSRKIIAQSKFTTSDLYFYQPAGDYIITVEAPGYRIEELKTSFQPGQEEKPLVIPLKSTWVPLPLQRLFR